MPSETLADFLRRLREARGTGEPSDAELLQRFAARQEERAFRAILQRHGAMVLGVCRSLVPNAHDAEDAFQATFLVLVSKAGSIRRPTLLANWLYRVAYRVGMRARANAARRHARETLGNGMEAVQPNNPIDPEMVPLLHEELNRLPDKYRIPMVLCYLQGQTHEAAARQLDWPVGTVKGRLARGRERLRGRLTRRGITLSAGMLAVALGQTTADAAVPASLADGTLKLAMFIAAGQSVAAGAASAHVASLYRGALQSMLPTRLVLAGALLLTGVIGTGAGLFAYQHTSGSPPEVNQPASVGEDKPEAKKQEQNPESTARQRNADNLQAIMRGMHAYHEVNNHLPPAALCDKSRKALLSWRVLLLPYLGLGDLFKEFHLGQPWDSAHNMALLAKMPRLYAPPVPNRTQEKHATFYQVFVGEGTPFEGTKGISMSEIRDGTSNTFGIFEAAQAVPWTKPADLPYEAGKPLPKLGALFDKGFHATFLDGSVHWLKKEFNETEMRRMIRRNSEEVKDISTLLADQ